MKKLKKFASGGDVRKSDRVWPEDMPSKEKQRVRDEAAGITKKYRKEAMHPTDPSARTSDEDSGRRWKNYDASRENENDLGSFWESKPQKKPYQYKKGGIVDKNDPNESKEKATKFGEHKWQEKGKTKGKDVVRMASGGSVRGVGKATKGYGRGRMC